MGKNCRRLIQLGQRTIVALWPDVRPQPAECSAVADALESRTLLSTTINLPLVNPGFDTLYKPGSTTITASIPNLSATEGFGTNFPVEQLESNLALASVKYSDGTTGTNVTVPGWTVLPIEHGPNYRPVAGIAKDSIAYPGKTDNFASIFYTPNTNNNSTQIRQTLVGTTLLPNSEYILSADVNEGGALNLEAGATFLTTARVKSTPKQPDTFHRTTKIYMTHANVPAGDVTVVLGSGGNSDGDFDNVSLTLISSGATPVPSPTPVALPFGVYGGRRRNLKLTQADGTIVTLSLSSGLAYATQDGSQIDLQLNSASAKGPNLGIGAQLGSGTFTLGNVSVSGNLNRLTAPAATLAGTMSIDGSIASLVLGSVSGQISANAIGKLQATAVTGVIYSATTIGSLKLAAVSGTVDAAVTIGSISAASLSDATVLSGVDLGSDGATPVSPSAAISYGFGSISALSVSGSVIGSVVAASANPVDGTFGNGNDVAAGTGQIASINIFGLADTTSRFEAPAFGRVKIHRATVTDLAADPRFATL